MFARSTRGLLDVTAAALCVWAAAYHTPPGALARGLVARLTNSKSDAKPLLSYYSGGLYDANEASSLSSSAGAPRTGGQALPEAAGPALGRGIVATLSSVPEGHSAKAFATAAQCAAEVARLRATLRLQDLEPDDAAVLAFFSDVDIARYAAERTRAEGKPLTLESLAPQLPPTRRSVVLLAANALALGTAYALSWPVAPSTRITSPFGARINPVTGLAQLHTGVDLSVAEGTAVKVVADGIVRRASEDGVNGRVVIVDHGRGVVTAYCHNSRLLVTSGARVRVGDVVAESGNTGRSTGPHLHYQLNLAAKPTDPLTFVDR